MIIAAPLLAAALPQLGDYLNHLARMYVITHIGTDPVLRRIYEVRWAVVPNLAMDLILPPLSHLVPLDVAGRIFIALALLLPVAGVVALHRSAFGGPRPWPSLSLLVTYNGLFFWGFLNFVVGIGLALLGTALWLREPRRHGGAHLAAVTLLALLLFACHLEALALFGVTIACVEFVRLNDLRRAGGLTGVGALRRAARLATPFVMPALLFLFAAPLAGGIVGKPFLSQLREYYWAVENSWHEGKFAGLAMPFDGDSPALDGLAAVMTAVIYIAQIARHGCRLSRGPLLAAVVLLAAYPFVPNVWLTAANLDCRLPVFAVFLAIASVGPNGGLGGSLRAVGVLLGAVLVARAGVVALALADGAEEIAECRTATAIVSPGERVLVVTGAVASKEIRSVISRALFDPRGGSFAPLLTIDRQAFWPSLFTSRTLQPVHVIPPYLAISVEQAETPSYRALIEPTPRDLALNPYLKDWRKTFDDVLVLQPGVPPAEPQLQDALMPLKVGGVCSLYRIQR